MSKNDASWTTVSGKPKKEKAVPSSTKPTAAPAMPKAEQKSINSCEKRDNFP